jgi:hypothetical protein
VAAGRGGQLGARGAGAQGRAGGGGAVGHACHDLAQRLVGRHPRRPVELAAGAGAVEQRHGEGEVEPAGVQWLQP